MNSLQVNIPISISPPPRSAASTASSYRKRMMAAMAIVGSLGKSFGNSMGRSFANSFGRSWGRDSFMMQLVSPSATGSGDLAHLTGLEDRFCRDFVCCGIQLENLHDLLQHFEECHVQVESDGEDDEEGLPFEFDSLDDMDTDMDDPFADPTASFSPSFLHTQSIALSEIYSAHQQRMLNDDALSAFDTSVVRKHSTGSVARQKRANLPTFTVSHTSHTDLRSHEPQTIPLAFDGPTRVIADCDMEDAIFIPPTMSVRPLSHIVEPSVTQDGHSSSASTIMTDADDEKDDRPYKCKMAGCNKAYKNPGGLKYHMSHGHADDGADADKDLALQKPFQCTVADCGKRYKNLNGLKYHIEHAHVSLLNHHQKD